MSRDLEFVTKKKKKQVSIFWFVMLDIPQRFSVEPLLVPSRLGLSAVWLFVGITRDKLHVLSNV